MKPLLGLLLLLASFVLAQACGRATVAVPTAAAVPSAAPASFVPGIPDSEFTRDHMAVSDPSLVSPPPISAAQAIAAAGAKAEFLESVTLVRVTGLAAYVPSGVFWILVYKPGGPYMTQNAGIKTIEYAFQLVDAYTGQLGLGIIESVNPR